MASIAIADGCNSISEVARAIGVNRSTLAQYPEIDRMLDAQRRLRPDVNSDSAEEFFFESRKAR